MLKFTPESLGEARTGGVIKVGRGGGEVDGGGGGRGGVETEEEEEVEEK